MTVTIRKAERRDRRSLGELGAMLMRAHYAFDPLRFLEPHETAAAGYGSFLSSIVEDHDSCVLVAEEEGEVIGYVYVALEPMSWKELRGPAGFIHDIGVRSESRRGGVARQLLQAATEWLRSRGAPRVILWTASQNGAAHALFRSEGFRNTMIEMTRELIDDVPKKV